MVTDHLPDRMGSEPIQSVKLSVIINTMQKSDGGGDGHGHGDGTCKKAHFFTSEMGSPGFYHRSMHTYDLSAVRVQSHLQFI